MEALIKVHPEWLKNPQELMGRISAVIEGRSTLHGPPFRKEDGYAWQLDTANNYFAEIRGGQLVIASRYGDMEDGHFSTLVRFLEVWLS